MSFRTPWKPPGKVATAATTNPALAHTEPPINRDFEPTKGSHVGGASGPSSPEGSKCTADSEDICVPNASECLEASQGSNCSQISKVFSSLELPNTSQPSGSVGNVVLLQGGAPGPSSPEGAKCTADSENICVPNASQCLEASQGSNCSQISKVFSSLELPDKSKPSGSKCLDDFEPGADNSERIIEGLESAVESHAPKSSKKSKDSKDPKSPQCSEDPTNDGIKEERHRQYGKPSEGLPDVKGKDNSQKTRDAKLAKSSKTVNDPKNPKRKKETVPLRKESKRHRTPLSDSSASELSELSSSLLSKSSPEDSLRRKVSKASKSSNLKRYKGSKRPEISITMRGILGSTSEDSTSPSSENDSPRSSQIPSQATSRGSQFLKQEAPLILSPPPKGLDARERLAWIQERRDTGVWVYCDNPGCDKQRYLADVHDPASLPEKWFCRMNRDPERNTCEAAEVGPGIAEEEDMIVSAYTAGSLVWARLEGYPEWPAMVDDDPDLEQYYWCSGYSDIPTEYHVTFFDSVAVTRAWLKSGDIRRFSAEEAVRKFSSSSRADLSHRLKVAHSQAVEALPLNPLERLRKFSFIVRYVGKINPGRKRTPPTPRRFLEMERKRNKKRCQSGKPSGRGGRHSPKGRGSQKMKQSKKKVQAESKSDASEDKEDPFSSDSSSDSSDQEPPSKKSRQDKLGKKRSQASSNAASKKYSKPCFNTPGKSSISTSQKSNPGKFISTSQKSNPGKSPVVKSSQLNPTTAISPTSTYNTPSEPPTRPSQRKLWLELDSSSDSDEECEPAVAAPLPAPNLGRTGETESFVSMRESKAMFDEEPASEDSIFAVAGSVCSLSHGVQSARKQQDCVLSGTIDSDFVENTPVDLLNKPGRNALQVNKESKLRLKVAAVPSDDEVEASSELRAKSPMPKVIDDFVGPTPLNDDFTDMD